MPVTHVLVCLSHKPVCVFFLKERGAIDVIPVFAARVADEKTSEADDAAMNGRTEADDEEWKRCSLRTAAGSRVADCPTAAPKTRVHFPVYVQGYTRLLLLAVAIGANHCVVSLPLGVCEACRFDEHPF